MQPTPAGKCTRAPTPEKVMLRTACRLHNHTATFTEVDYLNVTPELKNRIKLGPFHGLDVVLARCFGKLLAGGTLSASCLASFRRWSKVKRELATHALLGTSDTA